MSKASDKLIALLSETPSGFTSGDLEEILKNEFASKSTHHGSVSGKLNDLHKARIVFMLREEKDGRHPYVYHAFRDLYSASERYDKPPRNNRWKMVADKLYEAMTSENIAPTAWEDALTSYRKLKKEND